MVCGQCLVGSSGLVPIPTFICPCHRRKKINGILADRTGLKKKCMYFGSVISNSFIWDRPYYLPFSCFAPIVTIKISIWLLSCTRLLFMLTCPPLLTSEVGKSGTVMWLQLCFFLVLLCLNCLSSLFSGLNCAPRSFRGGATKLTRKRVWNLRTWVLEEPNTERATGASNPNWGNIVKTLRGSPKVRD